MALTLIEAAKQAPDPLTAGVMMKYAESHPLLAVLPIETITGTVKRWNREKTLPTAGFRGINGSWTAGEGVIDPRMAAAVIAGGTLEVDRQLLNDSPGCRETQEMMKVKALAHNLGHKLIKGDVTTTSTELDGLQALCTGTRLIANGSTSGGDVLSLEKLDQAIFQVPGRTHLVMSAGMQRLIQKGIRAGIDSPLQYGQDAFGRPVLMYGGLPILLMDGPEIVNTTLAFDESNPGGGSAVGQSIYVIRAAVGDGLQLFQPKPMEVVDLGHSLSATKLTTLVEWRVGMADTTADCAARLYGIKTGTPTA